MSVLKKCKPDRSVTEHSLQLENYSLLWSYKINACGTDHSFSDFFNEKDFCGGGLLLKLADQFFFSKEKKKAASRIVFYSIVIVLCYLQPRKWTAQNNSNFYFCFPYFIFALCAVVIISGCKYTCKIFFFLSRIFFCASPSNVFWMTSHFRIVNWRSIQIRL